MRRILIALVLVSLPVNGQQVIAQDTNGLIVEVKEKYGALLTDTCTVVMLHKNQFVLVRKDGDSGWFPTAFHSVRVVDRVPPRAEQKLVAMKQEEPQGETVSDGWSEMARTQAD